MPALLVATDFSATGNHAVHYACRLAADLQYEVTVLHAFIIPVAFSDTPMPLVPVQDMQDSSGRHLEALMQDLQGSYPDLVLKSELAYGDLIDCLREVARELQPALVVLGNNGAGDPDLWLGSTAGSVLRHLEAMVLAVPAAADYSGVRRICLACDYKDIDEAMPVAPLLDILRATGAQLHVVHADTEGRGTERRYEDTALPGLLAGITPEYHYTTAAGSVDERITAFAAEQGMDWLAIIPHHHGFWEGLFHKSHTRAMARMSGVPILAIHNHAKKQ
jgi:nucleotide-binding universal stress UspA family protein